MSVLLLVQGEYTQKKNSTVTGKFKYYLAQRFSNSGISKTPKLPQIRPGRDPYLIRLFSRLPHLMIFEFRCFITKIVFLKKIVILLLMVGIIVKTNTFFLCWDPLAPHQGKGSLGYGSLDPTLRVCWPILRFVFGYLKHVNVYIHTVYAVQRLFREYYIKEN